MVSTAAAQRQGLGFYSQLGSVGSLHILPVSAWVSSGCSGFLPKSKDVQVRLIGIVKLTLVSKGESCKYVALREWVRGGIVVGADPMGRMASFCTVVILWFDDNTTKARPAKRVCV